MVRIKHSLSALLTASSTNTTTRGCKKRKSIIYANEQMVKSTSISSASTTKMTRIHPNVFLMLSQQYVVQSSILMFLDRDDLISLTLVSKEFYNVISNKQPGNNNIIIQNRIVPIYVISPRLYGSAYSLISKLCFNALHKETKFRRYRHIKIDEYLEDIDEEIDTISINNLEFITNNIHLDWVTSLDMSLSNVVDDDDDDDDDDDVDNYHIEEEKGRRRTFNCIPIVITRLLPNLKELNISNIIFDESIDYSIMFSYSSYLERIIWNHSKKNICLSGVNFRHAAGNNHLRELILDDTYFIIMSTTAFLSEATSDLPQYETKFIFNECFSNNKQSYHQLERLSIRNAYYYYCCHNSHRRCSYDDRLLERLPQNALIKFVRNAPPSLRWFRSDLSTENIDMLRKERPEIELLN
jgi:hypothetical protein